MYHEETFTVFPLNPHRDMPLLRFTILGLLLLSQPAWAEEPPALKILFLGDNAGHQPPARFRQLEPVFEKRNISLTYTDKLEDLNADKLNEYDGLLIYANHLKIKPEQEKALLDYVSSGKGFIPVHCASYCFLNSEKYIALVGAQFRSHGDGVFRTKTVEADHPIMKGFQSFSSWDETYTHTKHNEKGRTVLEVRVEGDVREPWTWVRKEGKGRVFYTAWGHDHRTWGHPGFQNLLERGVRWACGQDPALAGPYEDETPMTPIRGDDSDFEYEEAKLPFYPARGQSRRGGQTLSKMQKPLTPEKSMDHYSVPEGFELQLFAADDDFGGKPIAMTWDEQGRLWVAVSVDYPNELKPDGKGRDKILLCEDTNQDGRADRFTVFADKLSIPTSLLNYQGGLIVHQAPHTLFLKDTNGDGKADFRQELLTGWGTGDTHAGPSNLRYGFDNWIYGVVGYSAFNGRVNGERMSFRQGYYRFKLEREFEPHKLKVTKVEFLRSVSNNTWGLGFAEDGRLFGSTANGCALVHMPIANRYYEKVRGITPSVLPSITLNNRIHPITDRIRQVDYHGGFTAAAGCTIYSARTYPEQYWNKTAFVTEPTGHLAATFVLQPTGTDFQARYGWNIVASDDEWASPIDTTVGPDGHVWVLDWYNFIVQHNPTPAGFTTGKGNAYETDLRDKSRGRIYRVVYKEAKVEKPIDLKDAHPKQLVETLKHHNMGWRLHAQRLLVERGKLDVVPELIDLLSSESQSLASVHSMWALNGLGAFNKDNDSLLENLNIAAASPSPAVRKAVIEAGRPYLSRLANAEKFYADPAPEVRLAAILALAEETPDAEDKTAKGEEAQPTDAGIRATMEPANWKDRHLTDAAKIAAGVHASRFLTALVNDPPKDKQLTPELLALIQGVAGQFANRFDADKDEQALRHVVNRLSKQDGKALREPILNGLSQGWVAGRKVDFGKETAAVQGLVDDMPIASRAKLVKLALMWEVPGMKEQVAQIANHLLETVADQSAKDEARLTAAKQLIDFQQDDETAKKLLDTLGNNPSAPFAIEILNILNASSSKKIGGEVVKRLKNLPPTTRPAALRLVLSRPESAKAFLDAVESRELRFDMLALEQRTDLANHPDKNVRDRAKKLLAMGGGLPDPNRQKVIDEWQWVTEKSGDIANGKKMFTQHCAKCHKHSGEGEHIGPDLTGMAVHPKEELLIHILDPSRSVEGTYRSYMAQTIDGRTIVGLLASETRNAIELIDAENKRHNIDRDDLEELKESMLSLMPEGFETQMKPEEMVDLLEFLTQKGKFVPIPIEKVATAVTTKGMFFSEAANDERIVFRDWSPKSVKNVPFVLVNPQGDRTKNAILLNSTRGSIAAQMPKSVTVPMNSEAKAIHMLSGVGGWNATRAYDGPVSLIVRLHYADGETEDHQLRDGIHFADYYRRIDVPGSEFAFELRGKQLRYLSISPKRKELIKQIELIKGRHNSAPLVMAITAETP